MESMLINDYTSSVVILLFSSFLGSVVKDLHLTMTDKEARMSFKKIFITWASSVVVIFAIISFNEDLLKNQFMCFSASFLFGLFGYSLLEIMLSESFKNAFLKIVLSRISNSASMAIDKIEEKENDKKGDG